MRMNEKLSVVFIFVFNFSCFFVVVFLELSYTVLCFRDIIQNICIRYGHSTHFQWLNYCLKFVPSIYRCTVCILNFCKRDFHICIIKILLWNYHENKYWQFLLKISWDVTLINVLHWLVPSIYTLSMVHTGHRYWHMVDIDGSYT